MISLLKKLTIRFFAVVNVAVIVLMLAVGFSDRIDPEVHPVLACAGLTFPVFIVLNFLFLGFWMLFYWRKVWIPIGGFLLGYVPINIYMPVRVMEDPPADCLKVMSFNVCGFGGRGAHVEDTFGPIIGYIEQQQPDIACLVEENDTWRHSDTTFAKLFAYNEKVSLKLENALWTNNIGVHTRFPIVKTERIDVETDTRVNGAAAFYLDIGTDTLLLVACHLENVHLNSEDRTQYQDILKGNLKGDTAKAEGRNIIGKLSFAFRIRAGQAKTIRQYVEQNGKGRPVIICGDFNDSPISFSRYKLAEGMTDCYEKSGCGLGLSYNQKGFNFRIDHMICSNDIVPRRCVIDSKMAESDHYPLVCWLKMRHNP